jgi:hypothetical protein
MKENDLLEYFEVLAAEEITLNILQHITDTDLQNLGLKLGARRKIEFAVANSEICITPNSPNSKGRSGSGDFALAMEIKDVEIRLPLGEGAFGSK